MSYPVTYYCPHCGTLVELERDGYLADKSVTPSTSAASGSSAARATASSGTRATECAGPTSAAK